MKRDHLKWGAFLLLCALICTGIFWRWAINLEHPGHADPAFYVEMATNISQNGSFQSDYIWHYFNKPEKIEHYAFDYWLPGTSIIQSIFISLTGDPLLGAAFSSYFLLILLSVIIALALRKFRYNWTLSILSGLAVCSFLTPLFMNLITLPYYLFFSTVSFLVIGLYIHQKNANYLYLSFLFASLAYWIRGDALLLFPFLVLVGIIFSNTSYDYKTIFVGGVVYFITLTPLLIINYSYVDFGLPSSYKALFLTEFNDLYAYWPVDNVGELFKEVGIFTILGDRILALFKNTVEIFNRRPYVVLGILPILWLTTHFIRSRKIPGGITLTGYLILTYSFVAFICYTFLFPYYRNGVLVCISIASVGVFLILFMMAREWFSDTAVLATFSFLALFGIGVSVIEMNETGKNIDKTYSKICDKVYKLHKNPRIMTRKVWDLSYGCNVPSIQVPSDGLKSIGTAVNEYRVNLFVIDKEWLAEESKIRKLINLRKFRIKNLSFELVWKGQQIPQKIYAVKTIND